MDNKFDNAMLKIEDISKAYQLLKDLEDGNVKDALLKTLVELARDYQKILIDEYNHEYGETKGNNNA